MKSIVTIVVILFIIDVFMPIKKALLSFNFYLPNFLRNNKKWLKYEVENILNKNCPDLSFNPKSRFKKISKFVFNKKQWWLIILGIFCFHLFGLVININFLNKLHLKIDSAKLIVDNRAANTVTIISMTLAVVGFLLSNIATKDNYAYKLLFKHSKLYSIIYFTLGTIASLIIISLLKDTITSEYYYSRLAISGTYLVIIVLFLIGFLFRSIIHFTNSKKIQKLLHEELMEESKEYLREIIFRKISRDEFNKRMKDAGAVEYNFFNSMDFSSNSSVVELNNTEVKNLLPDPKIIFDINIKKISDFISKKKKNDTVYFNEIRLNEVSIQFDGYLHFGTAANTNKENRYLRNSLILKDPPAEEKLSNEVRMYFDSKLEEYSSENKYKNLESLLSSYVSLYEMEMKNNIYG
jgi:hypothetical protein